MRLTAIAAVAKLQGPLQDDAVLALGRIGGPRALATLTSLAAESPSAGPGADDPGRTVHGSASTCDADDQGDR